MAQADASAAERHWQARAARLAVRVNAGWWWQCLAPALLGINLGGAALLLLFRQLRLPLEIWWAAFGSAWVLAAAWAWWRARGNFYATPEGLLRLETHLGLHNRLSAAAAGGVPWPAPVTDAVRPLRWRWQRMLSPLGLSAGFLLLGLVIPVGAPRAALPTPVVLPTAIKQVESWTEALKKDQLVESSTLEAWQEKLEQLRQRPAQEWYGQEGLEAAESLRDQMSQEIDALGKNLNQASALVNAAQQLPADTSATQLDAALDGTLANLQNGALPLRQNLAQALGSVHQLSASQLQQLQQQLKNGLGTCQNCLGPNAGGKLPTLAQAMAGMSQNTTGNPGGRGGGGPAPLTYGNQNPNFSLNRNEGVSNPNLDKPVVGETLAITPGGPPQQAKNDAPATAGGDGSAGNGGDAVWRQDLTPEERALLQRYFQ